VRGGEFAEDASCDVEVLLQYWCYYCILSRFSKSFVVVNVEVHPARLSDVAIFWMVGDNEGGVWVFVLVLRLALMYVPNRIT